MGVKLAVHKKVNYKVIRRAALFFIIVLLVFGPMEPGLTGFVKRLSGDTQFTTDYKLDPLGSVPQQLDSVLTESYGGPLEKPAVKNPKGHRYEDESKRTAFTSTYVNNDGTKSLEYSDRQQNYKDGAAWKRIDNQLSTVEKEAPDASWLQNLTGTQPKAPTPDTFKGKAGVLSADIKPLAEGVVLRVAGKTVTMRPAGANESVKPEQRSDSSIVYKDAWPNVDLEYELRGESVKEIIVVKNRNAQTVFNFRIDGGKVINHPTRTNELALEGLSDEFSFSSLTLDVNGRGVISEQRVSQAPSAKGDSIIVTMDEKWMKSQPADSFPMRIDPTYGRDEVSRWVYKSDGYGCTIVNCYANIGALYDNGWKSWRSYFQFPFSNLAGTKVLDANVHGAFKAGIGGDTGGRGIAMGHANCLGYWCQGTQVGWTSATTDFNMNFTAGMQQAVNTNDWGAVWSFWGEEGAYKTYKPYWDLYATIWYDTPTPVATPIFPANKQVIVDTQPTLKANPVTDADGDAVQYYFRVSTNPDGDTGAVINSGWINTPQWSIPEGILQDGTTYYWRVHTQGATYGAASPIYSFKVDLRTGKDSTQSFDTVGPVGIDLATGNTILSVGTHTMSALGGDMGLNLTYNTPNRAKKGLKAEYWNVSANYNFANGAPAGSPVTTVRDANIDFDWSTNAPSNAPGVNADWFYARWTGQFVAPVTGSYQFGGNNDNNMHVWVNNTDVYNNSYTAGGIQYGSQLTLQTGQAVPLRVEYMEGTGGASARLYVKNAVTQQVVPQDWLYTDVTAQSQGYGLTGRYYTDTGDQNIDTAAADPSRLMMVRQDTNLNFNFGSGGPAPGLQTDNFMTRWTGYITAPVAGSYKLGMIGDDGARIKVKNGASWTTTLDSWAYTSSEADRWGSAVTLPANTAIPIVIDYHEGGGGASFALRVQDATGAAAYVPATWLTPDARALPD